MGNEGLIIGAVTGIVLLIGVLKYKSGIVLKVIVQMILGGVSIYFVNYVLAQKGIPTIIAINPLTLLTSGILGFPGVFLLFAIHFFAMV